MSSVVGCWLLDVVSCLLVVGCWLMDAVNNTWMLVLGWWSLVVGYCFLAVDIAY